MSENFCDGSFSEAGKEKQFVEFSKRAVSLDRRGAGWTDSGDSR